LSCYAKEEDQTGEEYEKEGRKRRVSAEVSFGGLSSVPSLSDVQVRVTPEYMPAGPSPPLLTRQWTLPCSLKGGAVHDTCLVPPEGDFPVVFDARRGRRDIRSGREVPYLPKVTHAWSRKHFL